MQHTHKHTAYHTTYIHIYIFILSSLNCSVRYGSNSTVTSQSNPVYPERQRQV